MDLDVEGSGLHLTVAFDLHEDPEPTGLRKRVGNGHCAFEWCYVASVRIGGLAAGKLLHRRHRNAAKWMEVCENRSVAAHDHHVRGHAHVRLDRGCRTGAVADGEPQIALHAVNELTIAALPFEACAIA